MVASGMGRPFTICDRVPGACRKRSGRPFTFSSAQANRRSLLVGGASHLAKHSGELDRVHLVLEPLLAVDLDHGDPDAVAPFEGIVVLDVDLPELERRSLTLRLEYRASGVTQMTPGPRIQDDAHGSMLLSRGVV